MESQEAAAITANELWTRIGGEIGDEIGARLADD